MTPPPGHPRIVKCHSASPINTQPASHQRRLPWRRLRERLLLAPPPCLRAGATPSFSATSGAGSGGCPPRPSASAPFPASALPDAGWRECVGAQAPATERPDGMARAEAMERGGAGAGSASGAAAAGEELLPTSALGLCANGAPSQRRGGPAGQVGVELQVTLHLLKLRRRHGLGLVPRMMLAPRLQSTSGAETSARLRRRRIARAGCPRRTRGPCR